MQTVQRNDNMNMMRANKEITPGFSEHPVEHIQKNVNP